MERAALEKKPGSNLEWGRLQPSGDTGPPESLMKEKESRCRQTYVPQSGEPTVSAYQKGQITNGFKFGWESRDPGLSGATKHEDLGATPRSGSNEAANCCLRSVLKPALWPTIRQKSAEVEHLIWTGTVGLISDDALMGEEPLSPW